MIAQSLLESALGIVLFALFFVFFVITNSNGRKHR